VAVLTPGRRTLVVRAAPLAVLALLLLLLVPARGRAGVRPAAAGIPTPTVTAAASPWRPGAPLVGAADVATPPQQSLPASTDGTHPVAAADSPAAAADSPAPGDSPGASASPPPASPAAPADSAPPAGSGPPAGGGNPPATAAPRARTDGSGAGRGTTPGTQAYAVDLPSGRRTFLLHRPRGVVPEVASPVVLVLPGLNLTAAYTEPNTGMDAVSDVTGALVVYVDGVHGSWDAGRCCGYAAEKGVDDVTALHELVDSLTTLAPVDRRRVLVAGFSNGGMLAYRFACQDARGIAGVIVVSGALVTPACSPAAPVSLVVVHGRLDRTLPEGGQGAHNRLNVATPSVTASLRPFLRVDACRSSRRAGDTRWSVEVRRRCRQGSGVTVFRDAQGLHRWPVDGVPGGGSFSARAYALLAGQRSQLDFGSA